MAFFACCGLCKNAAAQNPFNLTSYTVKEGLSSNTVNTIIKDRYGLMWFGTSNGLTRFDGSNFVNYRHEAGNKVNLPANEVMTLCEDHNGRLWVGLSGSGVRYYDRKFDRFEAYLGDGSWPDIQKMSVRAMYEDHRGMMWVGTYGELRMIDLHTGHITKLPITEANGDKIEQLVVLNLFEDSRNRMWVGTNHGLFLYDWKAKSFQRFKYDANVAGSLSSDIVKAIIEDKNGSIWIGTYNGLNKMTGTGAFVTYTDKQPNGLSNNAIFTASVDNDGRIWLGTEDGINIFDPRSASFQVLRPDPRNSFSLKSNSIRSFYFDKNGIYWIGTYSGGISKYDEHLALLNLKQSNPFDPSGLKSPFVTSFAEYKNGQIFIGTDGGGLEIFNKNTGLMTPFQIKSILDPLRRDLTIMTLFMDSKGRLWAGTYRNGLFCIDPGTGKYRQFIYDGTEQGVSQNEITSIAEDKAGHLWIGTLAHGVDIYDPQTDLFAHISSKNKANDQYPRLPLNDYITSLTSLPNGDLCIGSMGSGIAVYQQQTRTFKHYDKENSGLADGVVSNVLSASDHSLWVGTNGGLCVLNTKTGRFTTYSEKEGLANAYVKAILEDKSHMLWVSTDRGISSFERDKKLFKNLNGENGVQQGSFISGSALKLSHGDLFFGGQDGFNYFNPDRLPSPPLPGTVLLSQLKVNNNTVTPDRTGSLKEQISIAKQIELHYGQNFSLSYIAVDYTAPKQNLYAYRLIGYDKDWNFVHNSTTASYTNMDPGTYVFQVKSSNNSRLWNTPVTEIKVIILPPVWRTTFAYCIYALIILGSLYFIRLRGINKLREEFETQQEKLRVQQMVDEERKQAERLHELDLLKIRFLTDLSHEFRTPISLVLAPVEKLLGKSFGESDRGDIQMIHRNVRRLLNLVNQLLDFRKMEENGLKLCPVKGDIISFITEAAESFKDIALKKHIRLLINSTHQCQMALFDHDKLERIIFNLLSNAFKFAADGGAVVIEINISENEGKPLLKFEIADTGIGIALADIGHIFDRFYQSDKVGSVLNQGTGIGLSITKEFVHLMDGEITVESEVGKGSKFLVSLPLTFIPLEKVSTDETNEICNDEISIENDNLANSYDTNTQGKEQLTTILLVEDNDEFRIYLADHLRKYFRVIEAANGKEGWQKTLSSHPQLVVSDISMPLMTGIELSQKIKSDKRTSHVPIIILTAMIGEEEQLKGLQSGANDYLTKPFNFQILHTKINNLLNLNKALKDTYSKQIQLVSEQVEIESTDVKLLNNIMKYIEANLSESELSVEDLSKHIGMSRGSLYYKVRELTGLSPIEYLRTVKLEKAAVLLESSGYNVAQIAYMTGFGTPSYFTRMFKAKFGILPSDYLSSKKNERLKVTAGELFV
ncbi:two-component regulator propeller domain-containing protein [Mucilaginibacter sp. SG564]|uniref:hybrid sensor histidine kinase/response regulator transcription factor n=1 Tax=Mucilaginibacter sp. SG564 TaxID=2587022 RepID=UPI0015542FE3|nr:two-component regulator propeller domain-containing protein [Mucilaginibacter sp. SG564]